MKSIIPEGMEIDGSPVAELNYYVDRPSDAVTADGRRWVWKADWQTYECHGRHSFDEGDWEEIK